VLIFADGIREVELAHIDRPTAHCALLDRFTSWRNSGNRNSLGIHHPGHMIVQAFLAAIASEALPTDGFNLWRFNPIVHPLERAVQAPKIDLNTTLQLKHSYVSSDCASIFALVD
jgi:hypothetical protein